MYRGRLPEDQNRIRERIIRNSIGAACSPAEAIAGLSAVISAFSDVLDPMIGEVATRAVISRAVILCREKYPALEGVTASPRGLDLERLDEALATHTASSATEVVTAVIDSVFSVLYGLLATALSPLLVDVEAELAHKAQSGSNEEER